MSIQQLQQQKAQFQQAYASGQISLADYNAAIARQNQLIAAAQARNQQPSPYYTRPEIQQKTAQAAAQYKSTVPAGQTIYYTTYERKEMVSNVLTKQIQQQNPELLKQIPQGSLVTGYNPKTQTVQYMAPSEVSSFKESISFYNAASKASGQDFTRFSGKYAVPVGIKPEQIESIKEVPNITYIPNTNIPKSSSGAALEFTLKPTPQQEVNKNSTFTFSNINIEGPFGVKPVIRSNEQRVLALEILGAAITAPFVGATAVAKGATIGIGLGQVMKTGTTYYNAGEWNGDISKSLLTPQEAIEAGATGVIFAGLGEATLQGLSKYGGQTGAKVAGFTIAKGGEQIGVRTAVAGEKIYLAASSTKQVIGASLGRVGAQTASMTPAGAGFEYIQTGQVTPEGVAQNALFAAGFSGLGEVGGKLMPHMPKFAVEKFHIGGVKGDVLELNEVVMRSPVEQIPINKGNIEILPRKGIVDVPYEGKIKGASSVTDVMAEANLSNIRASREKTVRLTTVDVANKRVTYAEAMKFKSIDDLALGRVMDISGEQKITTYQKPMFETEAGVDASGRIIPEVDPYGNLLAKDHIGAVKDSEIHGIGIFAKTNLAEGSIVRAPIQNVESKNARGMNWSNEPNTVRKIYLPDANLENMRTKFVTNRIIKTGEELTVPNYGENVELSGSPVDYALGELKNQNKLHLWTENNNVVITTKTVNGKVVTSLDVLPKEIGRVNVRYVSPEAGEVTTYGRVDVGTEVGIVKSPEVRTQSKPNLIDMTERVSSAKIRETEAAFLSTPEADSAIIGGGNRAFSFDEIKVFEPKKTGAFNLKGELSYAQKIASQKLTEQQIEIGRSNLEGTETLGEVLGRPFGDNKTSEVTSLIATNDIKALRKAVLEQKLGEQFSETRIADPYLEAARGNTFEAIKEVGAGTNKRIIKISTGESNVENAVTEFRFETGMEVPGAKISEFDIKLPQSKKSYTNSVLLEETHLNTSGNLSKATLITRGNLAFKLRAEVPVTRDIDILLNRNVPSNWRDEIINNYKIGEMEGAPKGVGAEFTSKGLRTDKVFSVRDVQNKVSNDVGDIISDTGRTIPIGEAGPEIGEVLKNQNRQKAKVEYPQDLLSTPQDRAMANFRDLQYNVLGDNTVGSARAPDEALTLQRYNEITKGSKSIKKPFEGYLKLDEKGTVLRDINNKPIYEAYSRGSKTEQIMSTTGKPASVSERKTLYVDVPKNLVSVDLVASQKPLNLSSASGANVANKQNKQQTYMRQVATFDASITEVYGAQGQNPFTSFKGRSYYKPNTRSDEDYESVYTSYPPSGLAKPNDLPLVTSTIVSSQNNNVDRRQNLGGVLSGVRSIPNEPQINLSIGKTQRFDRNIRTNYFFNTRRRDIVGTSSDIINVQTPDNAVIQTPDLIITPIQIQPIVPRQPDPIVQDTRTGRVASSGFDNFGNTFLPPYGSKFEGVGGSSSGGGKKTGVKSYKFVNPLLEGFQLLGEKESGEEQSQIF